MIKLHQIHKTYHRGKATIEAIRGIDLEIQRGGFIVLLGPSGGGKTTLLNLIGGIDRPTMGSILINDFRLDTASEEQLTKFRRDHIGFVFQFYNLIASINAVENVALPLLAKGIPAKRARENAIHILNLMGLKNRLDHLPGELSGGEQQRVAIARSLISEPELVVADEPTGDLDSSTANEIIELMHQMNKLMGVTFIVATHNTDLIDGADEVYELNDGRLSRSEDVKSW